MKKIIKKTIFLILTFFLALLILETSFRVFYSIKYRNFGYMLFGLRGVFRLDVDRFNEYIKLREPQDKGDELYLGFRTAPFFPDKPEDEYRIVALGESSTYGLYGGYYKSWPYLLEQKLNQQLDDRNYKVINAGIPGQTTYGICRLLKSEVLDWKPDMVILYTLYNHVDIDMLAFYKKNRMDFLFRLSKALFYDKSLIVTHLMDFIGSRSELLKARMDKYRYLLTEIVRHCNEKNADLIIVKQVIDLERFDWDYANKCRRGEGVESRGKYYEFLSVIDEVSSEGDCEVIDFSTASPWCKGRLDLILEDGIVHLSDYGKNLLADVIAKEITEIRQERL